MPRRTPLGAESGRLTLSSYIPCNRVLQRVQLNRERNQVSLSISASIVFDVSLCMVTPALAQGSVSPGTALSTIPGGTPPINATGLAVGNLCPDLTNQTRPAPGTAAKDLSDRCTEMIHSGTQQATLTPLLQASSYKIPSQGTGQVDSARVQSANLGARLAALRGGAMGISIRGLAFNLNGKTLPGTMLASLLPGNDSHQPP